MRGFSVTKNAFGFAAVYLHYSADPEKDPLNPDPAMAEKAQAWLDAQRASWPDPNDFQREFEISWYIGKGARVFPQYTATYHERALDYHRRKVIYRGWDFGWHAPVCLIAQIDSKDRLVLLKEIIGSKQTTRDFAADVVKRCEDWFPAHTPGYEDYCDPAGQQVKTIESEKNERRDVDVLQGFGIYPKYEWGWSRKDGRTLIHQLLAIRSDSTPSMWVDPAGCSVTSQCFLGRYIYPEGKTTGKIAEEPNDDEHPYGDVMAALRYLATGLHQKLAIGRFKASELGGQTLLQSDYHGYGTPVRR